jgi:Arc/MetJ-type ribon-helix-helix transcriptional regulator
MPEIEVTLPDRIDGEIDRLVESGEFLNREQAVEELLSMGVSAYDVTTEDGREEEPNEMFSQTVEEQQDPAMQEDTDEHTF